MNLKWKEESTKLQINVTFTTQDIASSKSPLQLRWKYYWKQNKSQQVKVPLNNCFNFRQDILTSWYTLIACSQCPSEYNWSLIILNLPCQGFNIYIDMYSINPIGFNANFWFFFLFWLPYFDSSPRVLHFNFINK